MADKEHYLVRVKGKLVEVTPEVYYAFYRMKRQEEWQEQKKKDHQVILCCDLDTEDMLAIENFTDKNAPSVEETVIDNDMRSRLHRALDMLPQGERELLKAIYFYEKTEANYGKEAGLSQSGVSNLRKKALQNLRQIFDSLGGKRVKIRP